MKNKLIFFSIILGLIYFISAAAKAFTIIDFTDVVADYGNFNKFILYLIPALIISLEIILSLGFLFQWKLKTLSKFSIFFLIILSLIAIYGKIFLGIENCGCFGSMLKIPFWISIIRNILMFLISYFIYFYTENIFQEKYKTSKLITIFSIGIIFFAYSFYKLKKNYIEITFKVGKNTKNTFLKSDSDKTLFFIFMPSCKHCQLQTPKVNLLLNAKKYKKIIGIYSDRFTEKAILDYKIKFKPEFKIQSIQEDSMKVVAHRFPRFIVVENNYIKFIGNKIKNEQER